MEEKNGISFTLLEAYSFRHIFQIIKKESPKFFCFIFRPKEIIATGETETGSTIISLEIDCSKLGEYIYAIDDDEDSGESIDEYPITINYDQMYNALNQIGIKDGVNITWFDGDNFLTVKPLKNSSDKNDSGGSRVNIIENPGFFFPDIYDKDVNPNINILVDSFHDQCKKIATHKCKLLKIIGQKDFLIMKGYDLQEVEMFNCKFESAIKSNKKITIDDEKSENNEKKKKIILKKKPISEDLITIEINDQIAKVYTKIKNITPKKAFISFYYTNNQQPMKIQFPIGVYGIYKIFIR